VPSSNDPEIKNLPESIWKVRAQLDHNTPHCRAKLEEIVQTASEEDTL